MVDDQSATDEQAVGATDATSEAPEYSVIETAEDPDAVRNVIRTEREAVKRYKNELTELKSKLAEYEDRGKTEQQKLAERADQAQRRAQDAELRALRYEVAVEKGLVGEKALLAKRLTGTTKEELLQDADELLKIVSAERTTSFDGGARGAPTEAGNVDSMFRGAARH